MTGVIIFFHAIFCIVLIVVILMQSGRGGGLTENFAAAESMFGAKTNQVMVKGTAIFGSLFLVTSLTLAHLSASKSQSLIPDTMPQTKKLPDMKLEIPVEPPEGGQAAPEAKKMTGDAAAEATAGTQAMKAEAEKMIEDAAKTVQAGGKQAAQQVEMTVEEDVPAAAEAVEEPAIEATETMDNMAEKAAPDMLQEVVPQVVEEKKQPMVQE